MSKRLTYLVGLSLFSTLFADNAQVEGMTPAISSIEPVEISLSTPEEPVFVKPPAPNRIEAERPFSPFTGKVKAKKVRLRANADLDSRVVKELNRNDLVVILGEKGDFYAVEPPQGSKAYVFRSFVLDGVVEGNRVNVRLEPSLDAPVIGHLNSGDRIKGVISSLNNKWYEISPPAGTRFFVAKEYIDSIGGVEVKAHLDKRRMAAEQLFDAATLLTQAEMKKSFREMDIERIKHNYQTVISDYVEFPELVDKAKEALNGVQEEYTQRKIAYLEDKAEGKISADEMRSSAKVEIALNPTDRMKMWEPVEESLYLSWSSRNEDRSMDEYYDEQRQGAQVVTGVIEPYNALVKRKPGDFMLKNKDRPIAYIYSTHINLQDFAGKKVTALVTPRSNNNFAFPAYFVLSVE